ncbi:CCR4-Not complex component, Not1-domain-containing protein [Halteromyces radiatus]|uniref:CCR4-Not complex component, Not1-domain-containing protein n=1 Tax=Halteromyces radiatus TaxID=101107 RepID=UPI00222033CB|nr:CCR4-Not complex component, Not1-domain-containing protein [Halteromyces radiatus]KAI8097006.1 CCR4-Not complex component, Not1-domain-containing protein [Halteromyces radiatus]
MSSVPIISNSTLPQQTSSTLKRIVKAQLGLLLSNNKDNYNNISTELNNIVGTHDNVIPELLLQHLLSERYKQQTILDDKSLKLINCLLKDTIKVTQHNTKLSSLISFGEALHQYICQSDTTSNSNLFDLSDLLEQLEFDHFDKLVISSHITTTCLKQHIVLQAKEIATENFKSGVHILSDLQSVPQTALLWIFDLIKYTINNKDFTILSSTEDIQIYSTALSRHLSDKSICKEINHYLYNMSENNNNNNNVDAGEGLLSKIILEAGYECCASTQSVEEILGKVNKKFTEKDIAECLGCMARTYTNMTGVGGGSPNGSNWGVENFVSVVKETAPDLDWYKVVENFDYEHFFVYDAKGLDILVRAWKKYSEKETFPANKFFGQWKNLKGQLSALYQMANVSTDVLSLVDCSRRKVIDLDDFKASNQNIRTMAAQLANTQLNSLDLIECVINLADTAVADDVSVFLEMMTHKSPELVFVGLIQIQPIKSALHKDLLRRLLLMYLNGNPGSGFVLTRLWQINPDFLAKSLLELYSKDATTLTRILDVTHELKILPQMLDTQPSIFAIDLAALASRREYLNLEKWLQDKIVEFKDSFIRSCLEFLAQKISSEMSRQETNAPPTTIPLSLESMATFLKVLSESPMTQENAEMLKEVQSVCLQTYPKLMNIRTQAEPGSTGSEVSFKPDVEDEANSYYERIYNGEMTIDEMIERLKTFSKSKNPNEQDIFACMIHNLFDEYHFFPKYPDKELAITSILFGSLIQHQLVSYVPLGIALRCVLDSLRNPPGSKMYNFGTQALAQFQQRLSEWPQYCAHLLQIPHLQHSNPDLIRLVNASLQKSTVNTTGSQQDDGTMLPNAAAIAPTPTETAREQQQPPQQHAVAFTSLHVPALPVLRESSDEGNGDVITNIQYETPPEAVQDKILFIINNVARNNLDSKLTELQEHLEKSSYQWFSNYLVVKRASIEPNYHDLYLLLLDAINSRLLREHVLRETYANIQILLNSEKTVSSSSERSLLKNLGSWLGGMTLARNKPIRHKNMAFKELLLEGYDSNRLIVVIPFVCKVLEQCSNSKVFKPPNPWVMAILKLLVELYQFADLKLNLKFEIEVLCKSLSLELKDIEATSVLKDRRPRDSTAQRNTIVDSLAKGDASLMMANAGRSVMNNQLAQSVGLDGDMDEGQIVLPNLAPYINFNPQVILYSTQPAAKRLVLQAINRSIREIIEPVVDRSVAIAAVSTRELVAKDFAMESDENKMRKAAHLMAQNLAGSLAMVTCKEPLRLTLVTNLRNIFLANGLAENLVEQAVHLTVSDNLDLVCAVIEKAAMEKATIEVDEHLMTAFANRKKHRDQRTGQPYYDVDIFSASRYPATLPEPLRAKPDGLQANQLRIYEDFARVSRAAPPLAPPQMNPGFDMNRSGRGVNNMDSTIGYGYNGNMGSVPHVNDGGNVGFDGGVPVVNQVSAHQILERFAQYITELEKLVSSPQAAQFANFQSLPPMHDIRVIIRQVPLLALSSFDKVEAARTFAQKVVQLLYKSETQLAREMYVVLLEQLCEVSPSVGSLVTQWLTHADDERKYNVPVTVALIKAGLINLLEQDQELAILIDSGRTSAIDFTARLIRACLFTDDAIPLASRQDFASSLDAFSRLRSNVPDSVIVLLEEMRRHAVTQQEVMNGVGSMNKDGQSSDDVNLREQLQFLFAEWVHLVQHPNTTEKVQQNFITQLSQQNIFAVDEMSSLFYRVCVEASIQHAIKYKQMPTGGNPPSAAAAAAATIAYQPIDAFSKLVVGLIQQQQQQQSPSDTTRNGASSPSAKLSQFSKVLSVIVLILAQHHEQRHQQFDQRPFLRLFTSLLSDLHAEEQQLQGVYTPILITLGNTLHTLQPTYFPGFTFAWLQLVSHRLFMPKLLLAENQKGWPTFERLLIGLIQFLVPFLRNVELKDTTRMLYRGTLRVLLVLLHDFPEFLCDYHYSFCDVVPSSCIQLRNLILSAFPRNMRLPDPFTPNLKVDLLPEIKQSPRILSDYEAPLEQHHFKKEIRRYLLENQDKAFLSTLVDKLKKNNSKDDRNSGEGKYNVSLINSLVFYVGVTSITQNIPGNQGAAIEIFQHLLVELDSEGRYLFLSAIANQLRYPNSHTHYFSCVLLYLFAESNKEIIKEQITRVLLERLIVNRPHPWGLLITFIELIKNPGYNFWHHSFTRCATDIERLFESVSRSINQI